VWNLLWWWSLVKKIGNLLANFFFVGLYLFTEYIVSFGRILCLGYGRRQGWEW
jgi:hypothetical protein